MKDVNSFLFEVPGPYTLESNGLLFLLLIIVIVVVLFKVSILQRFNLY